ncbi:hypothetical protein [Streptomyces sp. NPDC015130]|uniref:hypothetical protein n=1 Tax=Streptomyces sp. NPDC015130 TaxID=3364940 RepID=UPI0036F52A38
MTSTDPLIVSRYDVAMEPAPEDEPNLIIGAVADDGQPVALFLDPEARDKVARWLAPDLSTEADRLRAQVADLQQERHTTNEALSDAAQALRAHRDAIIPTGSDPTDHVEYQVIGGWGVDGADSAEKAVAAVHTARRAHPWDRVYAQQRTVRTWDDDSQWYGPWTDVPGAELPPLPRQQEDPHNGPLARRYTDCRDLPEMTA